MKSLKHTHFNNICISDVFVCETCSISIQKEGPVCTVGMQITYIHKVQVLNICPAWATLYPGSLNKSTWGPNGHTGQNTSWRFGQKERCTCLDVFLLSFIKMLGEYTMCHHLSSPDKHCLTNKPLPKLCRRTCSKMKNNIQREPIDP